MIAAVEFFFLVCLARKRFDHANAGEGFLHRYHHLRHAFLFVLHGFLGASPVNAERQQTGWKQDQCDDGEFPIHQKQDGDRADDSDRLFKEIAADAGQSHLHDPRVVGNARHQKTRAHFVKEIHGMADHLAKKLDADIGHHLAAHPLHAIGASI